MTTSIYGRTARTLGIVIVILIQVAWVKSAIFNCGKHGASPMTEEDMAILTKCAQFIKGTDFEEMTPDKIPCFAKCILEGSRLIDETGKPHKENILKGMDEKMDPEVRDAYKSAFEICLDEYSSNINSTDHTCMSYTPLATCVGNSMNKICKT